MVTAEVYRKKMAAWNKVYKQLRQEIYEKKLTGVEAATFWYTRIREEKLKMLGTKLSKEAPATAGEVLKHG